MLKLHGDCRFTALTVFNQTFEETVKGFGQVPTNVVINTELCDGPITYERKHREFGLRSVKVTPRGNAEFRVSLIGEGEINTILFDHNKLLESKKWFDQFIQFLIDGDLRLLKEHN